MKSVIINEIQVILYSTPLTYTGLFLHHSPSLVMSVMPELSTFGAKRVRIISVCILPVRLWILLFGVPSL